VADDPDRDLAIQIARLEHVLGRVSDDALDPDEQATAAEQAAESAAEVGSAFDRVVRERGGTSA